MKKEVTSRSNREHHFEPNTDEHSTTFPTTPSSQLHSRANQCQSLLSIICRLSWSGCVGSHPLPLSAGAARPYQLRSRNALLIPASTGYKHVSLGSLGHRHVSRTQTCAPQTQICFLELINTYVEHQPAPHRPIHNQPPRPSPSPPKFANQKPQGKDRKPNLCLDQSVTCSTLGSKLDGSKSNSPSLLVLFLPNHKCSQRRAAKRKGEAKLCTTAQGTSVESLDSQRAPEQRISKDPALPNRCKGRPMLQLAMDSVANGGATTRSDATQQVQGCTQATRIIRGAPPATKSVDAYYKFLCNSGIAEYGALPKYGARSPECRTPPEVLVRPRKYRYPIPQ